MIYEYYSFAFQLMNIRERLDRSNWFSFLNIIVFIDWNLVTFRILKNWKEKKITKRSYDTSDKTKIFLSKIYDAQDYQRCKIINMLSTTEVFNFCLGDLKY